MQADVRGKFLTDWLSALEGIFLGGIPDQYSWTGREAIIAVLNGIAPSWTSALYFCRIMVDHTRSQPGEPDCIEIIAGTGHIIKPCLLEFELSNNIAVAYFTWKPSSLSLPASTKISCLSTRR